MTEIWIGLTLALAIYGAGVLTGLLAVLAYRDAYKLSLALQHYRITRPLGRLIETKL